MAVSAGARKASRRLATLSSRSRAPGASPERSAPRNSRSTLRDSQVAATTTPPSPTVKQELSSGEPTQAIGVRSSTRMRRPCGKLRTTATCLIHGKEPTRASIVGGEIVSRGRPRSRSAARPIVSAETRRLPETLISRRSKRPSHGVYRAMAAAEIRTPPTTTVRETALRLVFPSFTRQ